MKKIVFAIGSLQGGGAERVVSVWSSALAERGYDVSVVLYSRLENEYPISEKVNVVPIAESQEECNSFPILKRLMLFRKRFKMIKPDIIISFLPEVQVYVSLATIGLGIPRIETIRNNPVRMSILKTKFAKLWLRCFKTCKALIVQSNDQKPFFSKDVQAKAVVIPNPIDSLYIDNKKAKYNSKSHKIVAAGRLHEQKNYKMMIDAVNIVVKNYKDLTLEIYGAGELESELNSYIKEVGLENNVKLMGRSDHLYNIYKEKDLYLMSSDYEGMPNALAEAMAIGLPCISTDCETGPRDLIDDGVNGFLVPVNDSAKMAEKISYIFSLSDEEQKQLGQNARNKVIDFCSEENSLNKLVNLIEKY